MHEYDTKFVQPRTQPLYRDVGTQYSEQANSSTTRDSRYNVVNTYTPMVNINRGFKISPNPNYVTHPELRGAGPDELTQRTPASVFVTPAHNRPASPTKQLSSLRQPNFRSGEGGSMGVYTHAASPLRKAASTNFGPIDQSRVGPEKRLSSPAKRMSVPSGGPSYLAQQRMGHLQSDRNRRESGRF
jgi:hypothetical protein